MAVIGDNKLLISFMRGTMRPGKPMLTRIVKECKQRCKGARKPIQWLHVERKENDVADFLGNTAKMAEKDILIDGVLMVTSPGMEKDNLLVNIN